MKRTLTVLIFTLVVFNCSIFSQYVNIYGGIKPLNFKNTNVQLSYLDESPDPDYFVSDIDLSSSIIFNVGASIDGFKHKSEIYYDLAANLFVGNNIFGGDINISAGYPFYLNKKKSITLVPAFSAGYGLSNRSLGELVNNTVYIQVNETRFKDYTNVDVSLKRGYVALRPNINFFFDLNKKFQIRLNAAYLYSIYTVNQISFSGKDNDDKAISDSEDLDEQNVSFIVDGKSSKESPIDLKGLEFRIGFAFSIGKKGK
jgi:hypothetical protein